MGHGGFLTMLKYCEGTFLLSAAGSRVLNAPAYVAQQL
jgi:hypothetical protein